MSQSFFIPGPLPGMNDYTGKRSRWHYSALKREWGATILVYIRNAKLKPMRKAHVYFTWQERNRKRDPDNIMSGAKFVLDALVASKILHDDGWDEIASIAHYYYVNATNPGVLVTLEEAL